MIILDTHVISEAIKPEPNAAVLAWLDQQSSKTLYLTTVTIAEMGFEIGALPDGKRKLKLKDALQGILELFDGKILPFDLTAAQHYADLAVKARSLGKGFPVPDGYIAAIAAARDYIVASRDVSAFYASGVDVIDPWKNQT